MVKRLRGFVTLCHRINSFSPIREALFAAKFPSTFAVTFVTLCARRASKVKKHSARVRHRNSDNLERGASKLRARRSIAFSRNSGSARIVEYFGEGESFAISLPRNTKRRISQVFAKVALCTSTVIYFTLSPLIFYFLDSVAIRILNGFPLSSEYFERECSFSFFFPLPNKCRYDSIKEQVHRSF